MAKRKDIKDFINDSNKIYNNKYNYSLVKYQNNKTLVDVICPLHGLFKVKPFNHLNGSECPSCNKKQNMDKDSFINRSKEIHGNKYDYSLVEYKNNKTKIKIICKIHGIFLQRPNDHLNGQGCPDCKKITLKNIKTMSNYEFIDRAIKIHGDKYDYSLVDYNRTDNKVKIICKKHGIFEQRPHNHLNGQGCKKCKMSNGEFVISEYLKNKNIKFKYQKTFKNCRSPKNRPLLFDFYLPEYNTIIEYDGEQHYIKTEIFGGDKSFENLQLYDEIKDNFCKETNIRIIRIPYYELDTINLDIVI